MDHAIKFQLAAEPEQIQNVAAFLEREWGAWREAMGDDPEVDWSSSIVRIVARDLGGEIVGAAVGRIRAGVGHLSELMVASSMRRQGLGTELVRCFEGQCSDAGCHKLTVHTELNGPAHAFYQRGGWLQEAVFRRDRGGRDFVRLYKFTTD